MIIHNVFHLRNLRSWVIQESQLTQGTTRLWNILYARDSSWICWICIWFEIGAHQKLLCLTIPEKGWTQLHDAYADLTASCHYNHSQHETPTREATALPGQWPESWSTLDTVLALHNDILILNFHCTSPSSILESKPLRSSSIWVPIWRSLITINFHLTTHPGTHNWIYSWLIVWWF